MFASMANDQRDAVFVLVLLSCLACWSYAYQFSLVWVVNPSESYSSWAQRMRFQVNDTISFRYSNASDSVLVVTKDDYDKCNTANPIQKLEFGNSVFKFDRSGPFYFISGIKANCDQSQKLIVVVLAVRNRHQSPANAPSPVANSPQGSSPSPSPTSGEASPRPANSPSLCPSPSPSVGVPQPSISPSSSPSPSDALESPSPSAVANAPAPGNSGSGAPSPAAASPGTRSWPPSSATPGSPESPIPGSSAPAGGNTPSDLPPSSGSPPPPSFWVGPACSPSVLLAMTVSLVLGVGLGILSLPLEINAYLCCGKMTFDLLFFFLGVGILFR